MNTGSTFPRKSAIEVSLWRRYTTKGTHRQHKERVWRFVPLWLRGFWAIVIIAEVFIVWG